METSRCIAQENVDLAGFCRLDGIVDDARGVRPLRGADNVDTGAPCPLCQLFIGRSSEGIRGSDQDSLALFFIIGGKLPDRSRLSDSIDPDHEDNSRSLLKIIGVFALFHPVADSQDQLLPAVCRIFDTLLAHFLPQMIEKLLRGLDPDVAHDHRLFEFIIEILSHFFISVEDLVHAVGKALPGLSEAFLQSVKKSHLYSSLRVNRGLLLDQRTDREAVPGPCQEISLSSIRSTLTMEDTPFSCIVMPYRRSACSIVPRR